MSASKACRTCGVEKPSEDYIPTYATCRMCIREREKARRHANREEFNAKQRARRDANRDRVVAWHRQYREEHRDRLNAQNRQWKANNAEKIRAYARVYYWQNLAAQRERSRVKAALARASTSTRPEFVAYASVIYRDPCAYCTGPGGELDHIVPVSRGGKSDWDNSTSACSTCNRAKHAKPLLLWMAERSAA